MCACCRRHASRRAAPQPPRLARPPVVQIQVKDGRVLVGDFTCLDKEGNIILTNTYEHMQLGGQ